MRRDQVANCAGWVPFVHLIVYPSEIAYDHWTTIRTLEAIGHRPAFGLNWDPSHLAWRPARLAPAADGPIPGLGDRLAGHGDVPWEDCFRMLNTIGYDGPVSAEWEDAGVDRMVGAPEALEFVRRLAFDVPRGCLQRRVQLRPLVDVVD